MSENREIILPRDQMCNGCQHLNFGRMNCRHEQNKGYILNTFTNAEGYIAVIRPATCQNFTSREKKKKNNEA